MRRITGCTLAVAALLFGAHTVDARISGNRISGNRLAANRIEAGMAAANRLTISKIAKHTYQANPAAVDGLMATPEGMELLAFLVACALPEGTTLHATAPDSSDVELFGEIGLAKGWITRPLNRTGKGWVSACIFARTSGLDVPVVVSMRGPHRALAVTPEETAGWTLQEGAFYGDAFTPDATIACRGDDEAAGDAGALADRNCTEPDPGNPTQTNCGFVYAGDCGESAAAPVCEQLPTDRRLHYRNCHAQPIAPHDGSTKYRQVITTFVVP
jgi:hypothetical protein